MAQASHVEHHPLFRRSDKQDLDIAKRTFMRKTVGVMYSLFKAGMNCRWTSSDIQQSFAAFTKLCMSYGSCADQLCEAHSLQCILQLSTVLHLLHTPPPDATFCTTGQPMPPCPVLLGGHFKCHCCSYRLQAQAVGRQCTSHFWLPASCGRSPPWVGPAAGADPMETPAHPPRSCHSHPVTHSPGKLLLPVAFQCFSCL